MLIINGIRLKIGKIMLMISGIMLIMCEIMLISCNVYRTSLSNWDQRGWRVKSKEAITAGDELTMRNMLSL